MRKLMLTAALLIGNPALCQTITLVQHRGTNSGSTSVSTQATAFTSNPAQNNLLVAGTGNRSTGAVSSCTDTLSNTWSVVQTVAGTNSNSGICWAIQTHTSGADTVTCKNSSAGVQMTCFIAEYSVTTSWPATPTDGGNTGSGSSTTPATSSFTTTGTDLLFAYVQNGSNNTFTAGSGYTLLDVSTRGANEDHLNASSGSYQGTFTMGSSFPWAVSAEAFKPNAPAGGCTPTLPLMKVGRCG